MQPKFWKLSQGTREFEFRDIIESISSGLVYVHKDTRGKGTSSTSAYFGAFRSVISGLSDHPFRFKPITDSAIIRSLLYPLNLKMQVSKSENYP